MFLPSGSCGRCRFRMLGFFLGVWSPARRSIRWPGSAKAASSPGCISRAWITVLIGIIRGAARAASGNPTRIATAALEIFILNLLAGFFLVWYIVIVNPLVTLLIVIIIMKEMRTIFKAANDVLYSIKAYYLFKTSITCGR